MLPSTRKHLTKHMNKLIPSIRKDVSQHLTWLEVWRSWSSAAPQELDVWRSWNSEELKHIRCSGTLGNVRPNQSHRKHVIKRPKTCHRAPSIWHGLKSGEAEALLLCRSWKSGGAGTLEKLEAHKIFRKFRQCSNKPKPPKTCYQAPESMSCMRKHCTT